MCSHLKGEKYKGIMSNLLTLSVSAFILLCIATFEIHGEEQRSKFDGETVKKFLDECAKETGIKEDEIKHLKELFRKTLAGPPSKELLCFAKCTGTKFEYLDPTGVINVKYIMERSATWPEIKKRDELQSCLEKLNKVSTCDNINDLIKCFHNSF